MFEDLPKNVRQLIKELPPVARALTILALLSFVFASVWVVFTGTHMRGAMLWVPPTAFAVLAVVFMLAAGFYLLWREVGDIRRRLEFINKPVPPGLHVGCRIGRRRLECGVLEVLNETTDLPSSAAEVRHWSDIATKDQLSEGALLSHADLGFFQRADLYGAVVASIEELFRNAHQKGVRIASIGIAVAGGVYPDRGTFDGLVGSVPFNAGEDITGELATRLTQQIDTKILNEVFGTSDPDAMRAQIHLDNDARCATRWLLVERDPSWKDIVCVFAGSGVGSGLAFGRAVFYGNRFRAGEIGHVNLNTGSKLLLDGMRGKFLQPRRCSCEKMGYHFESLISIGGLGHLAQVIDGDKLTQICDAYKANPAQYKQIQAAWVDPDDTAGVIMLRALAHIHHGRQGALFVPDVEPDTSFLELIRSKSVSDYMECVAKTYAQLFGTGIAALVDALDVDHIALCGTIPEFLQNNNSFTTELEASLPKDIPGIHRGFGLEYGDMRYWGWRGAALLPRDPGYMRRRFPSRH